MERNMYIKNLLVEYYEFVMCVVFMNYGYSDVNLMVFMSLL